MTTKEVYRVDNLERADDFATINSVVIDATDKLPENYTSNYKLLIQHCRSFYGKGFMFTVWSKSGGDGCSGEVVLGTDQEAYDKAVRMGIEKINEMQAELDDAVERSR